MWLCRTCRISILLKRRNVWKSWVGYNNNKHPCRIAASVGFVIAITINAEYMCLFSGFLFVFFFAFLQCFRYHLIQVDLDYKEETILYTIAVYEFWDSLLSKHLNELCCSKMSWCPWKTEASLFNIYITRSPRTASHVGFVLDKKRTWYLCDGTDFVTRKAHAKVGVLNRVLLNRGQFLQNSELGVLNE